MENRRELIKSELEEKFPEYTFFIGRRIYGKCIIAKNTKYSGADIFVKEDKIIIEAGLPDFKTRFLLGAGALYLKMFRKSFSEPSMRLYDYFKGRYENVKLRE